MGEKSSKQPLVWVDCEMTGLDIINDEIIQIACYVTDHDLNLLEESGFETVVHQPKEKMDAMGDWCIKTHAKTGLTERVLSSEVTPESAAESLLQYIQKYIPDAGKAILAGNSVHYDKEFLRKGPYVSTLNHLHHRILDVSSIKEAARRWSAPHIVKKVPKKKGTHEARQDILESIEEARYYRDVLFRSQVANEDESKAEQSQPKQPKQKKAKTEHPTTTAT
ncbi:ribonuclease H-like protein [Microthyrium microscopicum]|uniref:Ribonuclease H-like protein n=1 Tax=Microthyrium microscopicum TaxID=703497 RepID=A0A6A6U2C2_9PEZI|nr:ribonuclease H-like protein [Microthyrium microscopicum]